MILFHRKKNSSGRSLILLHHFFKGAAVFLLLLPFFLLSCREKAYSPKGKRVEIVKEGGAYRFYKEGKPFLIKGAVGHTHVKELAEYGGNALLIWDTSLIEKTLNEAQRYNVSVLVGLDLPGSEYLQIYKDEKKINQLFEAYSKIVNRFKGHPALLAWALGNEMVMPVSSNSSIFYHTYNRFLDMLHREDPDHPVTTTIINYQKQSILNIKWKIHGLDFISINTYNRLKDMRHQLKKIAPLWRGPFIVSEWAPNGGWEAETTVWQAPIENTSTKKAEQMYEFYNKYMPLEEPRFLGSFAFYWGSRHEYTHTWYSIFSQDSAATEAAEALTDCWQGKQTSHKAVKVQYMMVDSLGARDNILLIPGSKHSASVLLAEGENADSLRYSWEIVKEDWISWGRTWHYFKRPSAQQGLIADSTKRVIDFVSPLKEGPYRIYINVYNNKGYCATANTPFYVVDNEL